MEKRINKSEKLPKNFIDPFTDQSANITIKYGKIAKYFSYNVKEYLKYYYHKSLVSNRLKRLNFFLWLNWLCQFKTPNFDTEEAETYPEIRTTTLPINSH